jgi:hypothetical protein
VGVHKFDRTLVTVVVVPHRAIAAYVKLIVQSGAGVMQVLEASLRDAPKGMGG